MRNHTSPQCIMFKIAYTVKKLNLGIFTILFLHEGVKNFFFLTKVDWIQSILGKIVKFVSKGVFWHFTGRPIFRPLPNTHEKCDWSIFLSGHTHIHLVYNQMQYKSNRTFHLGTSGSQKWRKVIRQAKMSVFKDIP